MRTVAWLCSIAALSAPVRAAAHISLEQGGTHFSRYGDVELKSPPCGRAGGVRGTHIYTYEPGQTITVSLVEYVPHPSYFRIAFQQDGDDEFRDPASIHPIDPARACPDGPGDHCGPSDFYNTPNVLMDDLDPHLAGAAGPQYTWQVTLPALECDHCTLQVIQVMEDDQFHGPYDPTPGVGIEDVYHQCIDLVLKHGASQAANVAPSAGGARRATGCGTTGSSTGSAILLALLAAFLICRRAPSSPWRSGPPRRWPAPSSSSSSCGSWVSPRRWGGRRSGSRAC
jgi:hypothetical protein